MSMASESPTASVALRLADEAQPRENAIEVADDDTTDDSSSSDSSAGDQSLAEETQNLTASAVTEPSAERETSAPTSGAAPAVVPEAIPSSHPPALQSPLVPSVRLAASQGQGSEGNLQSRPKLLLPGDGRVTSAIPHKLQGRADNTNGNFALIHIDLTGTTRGERDAAAKRTSESTAAAAQRATKDGYRAIRRSRLEPRPEGIRPSHVHPPSPTPAVLAAYGFPSKLPEPDETKSEQARLLALMRSINPNSIIDQLCKGVAYFGGVPGTPPPPNKAFPLSASSNGSGALFVSWLAEIFPPVYPAPPGHTPGGPPISMPPPAHLIHSKQQPTPYTPFTPHSPHCVRQLQISRVTLPKRRRGRPKGSKSKRPRKDKGIRKGPRPGTEKAQEGSQVDGSHPTTAALADRELSPGPGVISRAHYVSKHTPRTPFVYPSGKRRGRPPGSKNRSKAGKQGEDGQPLPITGGDAADDSPSTGRTVEHGLLSNLDQPAVPSRSSPTAEAAGSQGLSSPSLKRKNPAPQPSRDDDDDDDNDSSSGDSSSPEPEEQQQEGADTSLLPAQPQAAKRRRTSNGAVAVERPETVVPLPSALPVSISPTVNPSDLVSATNSTPGGSFDSGSQPNRPQSVRSLPSQTSQQQPQRPQQNQQQQVQRSTQLLAQQQAQRSPLSTQQQQQQQQKRQIQQATQGQTTPSALNQAMQRPIQPDMSSLTPAQRQQLAQSHGARQQAFYTPQQNRPQVPDQYQRTMVGPQQTANSDAQPIATMPRPASASARQPVTAAGAANKQQQQQQRVFPELGGDQQNMMQLDYGLNSGSGETATAAEGEAATRQQHQQAQQGRFYAGMNRQ